MGHLQNENIWTRANFPSTYFFFRLRSYAQCFQLYVSYILITCFHSIYYIDIIHIHILYWYGLLFFVCFFLYLVPSGSFACASALLSTADGPGLETDALLTCPLPLALVGTPCVSSVLAFILLCFLFFVLFWIHYISIIIWLIIKN